MATRKEDRLLDRHIARIARELKPRNMIFIAVLYMDLDLTKLENLSPERTSAELYHADIIRTWKNRETADKKVIITIIVLLKNLTSGKTLSNVNALLVRNWAGEFIIHHWQCVRILTRIHNWQLSLRELWFLFHPQDSQVLICLAHLNFCLSYILILF